MPKKNKFNAEKVYYHPKFDLTVNHNFFKDLKGFERFDSMFECKIYKKLLYYTPYVKRQIKIPLVQSTVILDFVICYLDKYNQNKYIFVEAKGFETNVWKLKYKQLVFLYPNINIFVIRNNTELTELEKFLLGKNFCSFTEENIF